MRLDPRRAERRARGRGVRRVPPFGGRAGGRRRVPREARGSLDRTLKAVVLHEVGGPLALEDVPEPDGGAILDVRAAGINFADMLIRRGLYPQMPELPHVLGSEVAGELDGRRVLGLPRAAGGYAERVEVDPEWTFPLPDNASFAAGASFLTTYLTAYIPLHRQLRVTTATTVLVHAGSGGVGCAAIQLAKNLGATVDRDGELRREARLRARGRRRRGARLRRARRSARRRRARPGRRRRLHQRRWRCSTRSARSSRSASPAGCGPIRACSGSSAGTRRWSGSTSAG